MLLVYCIVRTLQTPLRYSLKKNITKFTQIKVIKEFVVKPVKTNINNSFLSVVR